MLLPLAAIAAVFLGLWVLALGIESGVRSTSRPKSVGTLPKTGLSLLSLLLFLFAPTRFMESLPLLKSEAKSTQSIDS